MGVTRSIRVVLPDRPGALAAIATALAAHRVDIVRLEVVSHEGTAAVDDLLLEADSAEAIGSAIGAFWPEVVVRTFETSAGDGVCEAARTLAEMAAADSGWTARRALIGGALRLCRAERGAVLRRIDTGAWVPVAGLPATATVSPGCPAPALELRGESAQAFAGTAEWFPGPLGEALGSAWVAVAPLTDNEVLAAGRRLNIPFCTGELERLSALCAAGRGVLDLLEGTGRAS